MTEPTIVRPFPALSCEAKVRRRGCLTCKSSSSFSNTSNWGLQRNPRRMGWGQENTLGQGNRMTVLLLNSGHLYKTCYWKKEENRRNDKSVELFWILPVLSQIDQSSRKNKNGRNWDHKSQEKKNTEIKDLGQFKTGPLHQFLESHNFLIL